MVCFNSLFTSSLSENGEVFMVFIEVGAKCGMRCRSVGRWRAEAVYYEMETSAREMRKTSPSLKPISIAC